MDVEICTVSGFDEVGRNMVAIRHKDSVVICDMGLNMEPYIKLTEESEEVEKLSLEQLQNVNAVPNDEFISDWVPLVKAIVPSHGHLDHVGAIPWMARKFNCPVICTPFTAGVLERIISDDDHHFSNEIKKLDPGGKIEIEDMTIEFVQITHSIPQSVMIAIHTAKGIVLYTNDYKFDDAPLLGKVPDYERLEQLGNEGVLAVICDSLNAHKGGVTLSEKDAKEMLEEVLLETTHNAVIVTTFSSHIARLKSIVEIGKRMNRKIVMLGRSLHRYVSVAESLDLVKFSDKVEIVRFATQIRKKIKHVMDVGPEKFLMVVTGHQGEPKATLSKMVQGIVPFKFDHNDAVVFSCSVIPTESNKENRVALEKSLADLGVQVYRDIHVSGHASGMDHEKLLKLIRPKYVIPSHGHKEIRERLQPVCDRLGKSAIYPRNGERLILK